MPHLLTMLRQYVKRPSRKLPGAFLFPLALAATLIFSACSPDVTVVGILEVDLSTSMEETRTGFLEALLGAGYKAGETARFVRRNEEVREQPLGELAEELTADEDAVLVFVLSTEALAAAATASTDTPIVFAMSGNPLAVLGEPMPANVTGAIAAPPDRELVGLIRQLLPRAVALGIVFNPNEPDSVLSSETAAEEATASGLSAVLAPVSEEGSAGDASTRLVAQGVDAVYVTASALLERAFADIAEAASTVPIFATGAGLTNDGALASYEVDREDNGRRAGKLAVRVLAGEAPATIGITSQAVYTLSINLGAAERLGLAVPDDIRASADQLFD